MGTSPEGFFFDLENVEATRPDVFLMSHAAAYTAWYQVRARH
jgi:hypothetical protein